jgi:hypothetical protein
LPDEFYIHLIKYVELDTIFGKLVMINKRMKSLVEGENYLLFKHFLRSFNLPTERLKRAELPGKVSIPQLIRENFELTSSSCASHPAAVDLRPYTYYTDGGTYNDDPRYFLHNIFSTSGVCHSTKVPTNANLQIYLGK